MWYLIIILVVCAGAIGFAQRKNVPGDSSGNSYKGSFFDVNSKKDTTKEVYTRKELMSMLKVLAESPAPEKLSQGAMCYKVAYEKPNCEYVCPLCNKKTILSEEQGWKIKNLNECRSKVKAIKGIDISLDEKEFCLSCSPNVKNPVLSIHVKFNNESSVYTCRDISPRDLDLIRCFLEGKNTYSDITDNETPLKEYLDRIQELLGLELSKINK